MVKIPDDLSLLSRHEPDRYVEIKWTVPLNGKPAVLKRVSTEPNQVILIQDRYHFRVKASEIDRLIKTLEEAIAAPL